MDKLEVFGARKLKGSVRISGSKNAALPILAASILSNQKIILKNLPNVKDIKTMIKLLESIGSTISEFTLVNILNSELTRASYP